MVTSKSAEVGDRILKVTFCFILMEEIWKDVVGYEGLYQVSNLGNVRKFNGKILKQTINTNGYMRVSLYKDKKSKFMYVHRLVAMAFINQFPNTKDVDHINGVRNDNNINNLRWCTRKENLNFPIAKQNISLSRIGKKGILSPMFGKKRPKEVVAKMSISMALKNNMPIKQYTKDGVFVKDWVCAAFAERETGINQNHIRECCRGKCKSAGGFVWKFKI